jgi:hypothetical protein
MSANEVLVELSKIARANMGSVVRWLGRWWRSRSKGTGCAVLPCFRRSRETPKIDGPDMKRSKCQ